MKSRKNGTGQTNELVIGVLVQDIMQVKNFLRRSSTLQFHKLEISTNALHNQSTTNVCLED